MQGDIHYGPPRAGDMPRSQASTAKAKRLLGYEPLVDARQRLERTVAWYRNGAEFGAPAPGPARPQG